MSKEIGIVIGRFQPFHKGHEWLINRALEKFEKIIILIGSPNVTDINNPWSYSTRERMIKAYLREFNISDRVIKILGVEDVPDDDKWLEITLKKIGEYKFSVIGDNEWVNGIFEKEGYSVLRPGYFERDKYEGVKIRKLFKEQKNWESKVPKYIVKLIKT